jgi:DNA-binding MarR family transcriptional regulator
MASTPRAVLVTTHRNRGFDCLCGNMRMASRAVTALYDGYLAPAGLTAAELSVLWCVMSAQPLSMQKISEFLAMEKSTVTRNVAHLRLRHLLKVEAGKDARMKQVSVTRIGREAFVRALPLWKEAQKAAAKALGQPRFRSLVAGALQLARVPRETALPALRK